MNKNCPKGKIYNPKTKRYINDTPINRLKLKQNRGGTLTTTPKRLNVLSTQKLVNTGFTANNISNNKTKNVFTRSRKIITYVTFLLWVR